MKKLLLIFALGHINVVAQDNVTAAIDSLTNVYYYNKVELFEPSSNTGSKSILYPSDADIIERFKNLNQTSPIHYVYNEKVKSYINFYLKNYKSISVIQANSNYYFSKFDNYLIKYNIPLELKYLSVIESALNPTAKSYCGAAGLWQFMPATGKAYGLDITSFIDERYDSELATDAACRYLKDLFSIYNDWSLAIAAYNCGAGNVNKAIKRSGGKKDFFLIMDFLPKETQGYVPAFMASSYLMKFFKEHNLPVVNPKWNFIEIDSITIKKPISINQLANLLNIPQKELSYLNPNFYIGQIPGNDNRVIIPAKKALAFIDIETQINGTEKQQKITAQNNPRVKHDPFGTVEINSIPQAEIKLPTTDVILCEAINSYNPGVDEYLKLRNLKAIGAIPANSILLGKAVTLNAKKFIKIFKVVNTNETINLLAEYLGKINEGETLFVKQ